ncbi:MAG: hypothetical protein ACRC20_17205 [Segniliparus sp.]|uniref:hypothetical protein n=1 Tax=Segniliparus sp. TaxID=2804064 RepID=UPI003F2BB22D
MRSGTKPGAAATRQRSKAAARALRRRDVRMGQASDRRPVVESSRRQSNRNAAKGFARSALPSLPDGEKLWWMIAVPSRELLRRVPFVIGVMGLLAVGLATTLWLATRSTEDASTLSTMRAHNRELQQEQERLERGMEQGQSITELARRAGELGMVPARDVAKLVPQPDGSVQVVGELKPAAGGPEQQLGPGPAKPGDPAKTPPPAPNAPAPQGDNAPAPAPAAEQAQPDESVERVRPTEAAPAAPAAPVDEPEQPPVPGLPSADPMLPVPPMSQAGSQSPAAMPGLPSPAPAPQLQAPRIVPVPPADNPAPPPLELPGPVASQPAVSDQPEQEPHE